MADALNRAKQLIQERLFEEALEELRRVVQSDPQNALAFQGVGYSLMRLNQYNDAIRAFQRALELEPKLVLPHAHLGHIYYLRKQYAESEEELRQAIELDPNLFETTMNLAILLSVQWDLEEAEAMIKRAIELDPKQSVAHCVLSEIYIQQKRFDEGIQTALHAFTLSPSLGTGLRVAWAFVRKYTMGAGMLL